MNASFYELYKMYNESSLNIMHVFFEKNVIKEKHELFLFYVTRFDLATVHIFNHNLLLYIDQFLD